MLDRIGAGDAYAAGVLLGYAEKWSLQRTADFAITNAVLAHTMLGGRYPVALAPQLLYGAVILLTDFSYFLVGKSLVRANPDNQAIVELFRGYKKLYFTLFINVLALLLGWLIHPLFIITLDSLVLLLWVIPEKKVETFLKQ